MKLIKKSVWAFLIAVQIVSGVGAGLLILSVSEAKPQIVNTKAGEFLLDGVSTEKSRQMLFEYYSGEIKNGSLVLEIDRIPFAIPYSDIDVHLDLDKTMENLAASLPANALESFFSSGAQNADEFTPVFTYNAGKLIRRCEELLSYYEIEPVPESYGIENGKLIAASGSPGLEIDYKLLEQELKSRILVQEEIFGVDTANSPIFIKTFAAPIYKASFNTIVTKSKVGYAPGLEEKVRGFFEILDAILVDEGQTLSLHSLLDFSQFKNDMEKDLLNRLATALYQAALPMDGIKVLNRRPAQRPVAYAQSGLEAVIEGEGADLVLKNETGNPLLLLTEIMEESFDLYFVSTDFIKTGALTVEERDHVPPSVITIINESLSPNAVRIVSEGIPGFTAYVTRTIDGVSQEISRDKYLPVSKTVETGQNIGNKGSK